MRRSHLATIVGALAISLTASAEPIGFSVASDSDSPTAVNRLHRIDLATGQAQVIDERCLEALDSLECFEDIEGLAFGPDGTLFGADDASDTLLVVDTQTGEQAPVNGLGSLGLSGIQDYGMSFDCDGQLWLAADTTEKLYRVDTESGEARLVGDTGEPITALAAAGDTLYGLGAMGREGLYEIDTETGAATLIATIDGMDFQDGGMSVAADGTLWVIAEQVFAERSAFEPSRILTIDPDTGTTDQIATTVVGLESLAIDTRQACAAGDVVFPPADPKSIPALSAWGRAGLAALAVAIGALVLRARAG